MEKIFRITIRIILTALIVFGLMAINTEVACYNAFGRKSTPDVYPMAIFNVENTIRSW